jgi:hypothetical protein
VTTTIRDVAVTRQLRDGRQLEIAALISSGCPWVEVCIDGAVMGQRLGIGPLSAPATINGVRYTHEALCDAGQVVLTTVEAAAVEAAMDRVRATYAATPDGLRAARARLAHRVRDERDMDSARREAAWDREDEAGWVREDAEGRIAAAQAALVAFDAAHPEIRDERRERQDAALLADQIAVRDACRDYDRVVQCFVEIFDMSEEEAMRVVRLRRA